jgi:glutaredoxin
MCLYLPENSQYNVAVGPSQESVGGGGGVLPTVCPSWVTLGSRGYLSGTALEPALLAVIGTNSDTQRQSIGTNSDTQRQSIGTNSDTQPQINRHQFWYSTTNQLAPILILSDNQSAPILILSDNQSTPILILNHKSIGTNSDTEPQLNWNQFWYSTTNQSAPILILNHNKWTPTLILNHKSIGTNSDTKPQINRH